MPLYRFVKEWYRTHFQSPRERFQVLSDLHLETEGLYETFSIPPVAKYLILCGDIGNLRHEERFLTFLTAHLSKFDRIFLIMGNHEFYGITREEGWKIAHSLEARLNGKLVVMNRTRVDLDNSVTLLGCTLQSHIDPQQFDQIKTLMQDFKRIKLWTPEDHNNEHQLDLSWLKDQHLSIPRNRQIVICTHHSPTIRGTSRSTHKNSVVNSAFATELFTRDARWRRGSFWIYGHTHYNAVLSRKGVTILSNQRGYFEQVGNYKMAGNDFKLDFTIAI